MNKLNVAFECGQLSFSDLTVASQLQEDIISIISLSRMFSWIEASLLQGSLSLACLNPGKALILMRIGHWKRLESKHSLFQSWISASHVLMTSNPAPRASR